MHWAAPHEVSVQSRGGSVGSRRFAALMLHLCDSNHQYDAGGAFVWCTPHARVPCTFNQLVMFGLGGTALHGIEPVISSSQNMHGTSRWTVQAWASLVPKAARSSSASRALVMDLLTDFAKRALSALTTPIEK